MSIPSPNDLIDNAVVEGFYFAKEYYEGVFLRFFDDFSAKLENGTKFIVLTKPEIEELFISPYDEVKENV